LLNIVCNDKVRRLIHEGGWVFLGQIASVGGSLVLVRVLTEYLTPAQYGQLALALTLGALICQMSFSGSMPGIMRYYSLAVEKEDTSTYFNTVRQMMLYSTLVAFSLSVLLLLGFVFVGNTDWLGIVAIAITFSILGSYNATMNIIQNAARQRQVVALHSGLDAWLKVLFALMMFTWWTVSHEIVVIAYVLSLMVVLVSQSVFLRKLIPKGSPNEIYHNKWMQSIWIYSKPFVFFNFFTWVQASSDRWVLEIFTTTHVVGLHATLIQLGYTPISIATGLVVNLVGPILFQRSGDASDRIRNESVHRLAWLLTLAALTLTLFVCGVEFFLHEWIFQIFVASEYRSVSHLLPWMTLAGGVFAAGQILALKLMSELDTQALLWPKILTSILGTLLSCFGGYVSGLNGIVVAVVVFASLHFLWLALLSQRLKVGNYRGGS